MAGEATERIWQDKVEHIAKMNGWMIHHPSPHQVRPGVWRSDGHGFPDLCLSHRTKGLIFAELKLENTKLTPGQVMWANALKPWAEYYVWRPSMIDAIAVRLGQTPEGS